MPIQLFDSFSEGISGAEYRDLLSRSDTHTVFNEWPWVSAAYRHLHKPWRPLVLTVRDSQGRLIACLTLKYGLEWRYGMLVRTLRWVQHPLGDRMGIPCDRSSVLPVTEILRVLRRHGPGFDVLELDELYDADQIGALHYAAAGMLPMNCLRLQRLTPIVHIDGWSLAEIEAAYPQNLKRKLRRCRNKLARYDHKIRFDCVVSEQVDSLLALLRDAETASWKGEEGVGIFSTPASFAFFLDVSRAFAKAGQLAVGEIWVNGELASYRFGFIRNRVFFDYNLAYTPKYKHLGAGRLLLDEIVLECARRGLAAIDGSRTSMNTSNLLIERSDDRIAHYCWTHCRPTPSGIGVWMVLKFLRPLRDKFKAFRRVGQSGEDAAADGSD